MIRRSLTVGELIEKLKEFDSGLPVESLAWDGSSATFWISEVELDNFIPDKPIVVIG